MHDQLTLGEALAAEGMARAAAAASSEWQAKWDAAIEQLAATGEPFTTDEIREIAGPPANHAKAAGARLRAARARDLIRHTGTYRPSRRPELHAHPIGLWVGTGKTDRATASTHRATDDHTRASGGSDG